MEAYELEDRVLYDAAGVVTALAGDLSDTLNDMTAHDVLPQEPLAPQELLIIYSGI
ncbi:MAG: hypothetical protein HRT88_23460, partial [Lentisphaeraceae bacterium]|nr:hypothetical protein [Lentisphaeraceae bacterium]